MPARPTGIEVYETNEGKSRYRVRWREGLKRRSKSFSRLNDAITFHSKTVTARETGKRVSSVAGSPITVSQFVDQYWLPEHKSRVIRTTYEGDKGRLENWILPWLGHLPMNQVDSEDIVQWQREIAAKGAGPDTRRRAISIVSQVFKEGGVLVRTTGVTADPTAMVRKPSVFRKKKPKVYGPETIERVRKAMLDRVTDSSPKDARIKAMRDALMVSISYMAGTRPGEAEALTPNNIRNELQIVQVVSDGEIVTYSKTRTHRFIPIRQALRQDIDAYLEITGIEGDQLLFAREQGDCWKKFTWDNWRRDRYQPALEKVGLEGLPDTRPYDLGRHSHSALMLASGMSIVRLAEIQGHSVQTLLKTYAATISEYRDQPPIDPDDEIAKAREKVFGDIDPSTGMKKK